MGTEERKKIIDVERDMSARTRTGAGRKISGEAGLDLRWARALSHPVRIGILRALVDDEIASSVDLAPKLGVSHGVVRNHLRRLEELGFVALTTRTPVRDARRRYFGLKDRTEAIVALEHSDLQLRQRRPSRKELGTLRAVGGVLRAHREEQQLPLTGMAHRLSISSLYLERIERGDVDPPVTLLMRYAGAVGMSCAELAMAASR